MLLITSSTESVTVESSRSESIAPTPAVQAVSDAPFLARRRVLSLEAKRCNFGVAGELQKILGGYPGAADWLYEQYSDDLLRRLTGRYGLLYGEPEDLLQDAFLFYFQNDFKVLRDFAARVPAEAQTHARLGTALWDLACGLVANRRRASRNRDKVFDPTQNAEELESVDEGFERRTVLRDELRHLDSRLRSENPSLSIYCRMRFEEGYSPTEIARITGWPPRMTYKLRQSLNQALSSFVAAGQGRAALPA